MIRRHWTAVTLLLAGAIGGGYGCQIVAGLRAPRPLHCANGLLDSSEKQVDCGGDCPACTGDPCSKPEDCRSLQCGDDKTCHPHNCDQVQDECWPCHACHAKDNCASATDCESGFCDQGQCQVCGETLPCPVGDCRDGACVAVTCAYDGSCGDAGAGGGDAGDGDAGDGGNVDDAGDGGDGGGTTCMDGGDCPATELCTNGVCVPHCNDLKQNGDESDIDCGGSCAPCADGRACEDKQDCVSMVCLLSKCQATCSDGVLNGKETDIDCGGGLGGCEGCTTGKHCQGFGDCKSLKCVDHLCQD